MPFSLLICLMHIIVYMLMCLHPLPAYTFHGFYFINRLYFPLGLKQKKIILKLKNIYICIQLQSHMWYSYCGSKFFTAHHFKVNYKYLLPNLVAAVGIILVLMCQLKTLYTFLFFYWLRWHFLHWNCFIFASMGNLSVCFSFLCLTAWKVCKLTRISPI